MQTTILSMSLFLSRVPASDDAWPSYVFWPTKVVPCHHLYFGLSLTIKRDAETVREGGPFQLLYRARARLPMASSSSGGSSGASANERASGKRKAVECTCSGQEKAVSTHTGLDCCTICWRPLRIQCQPCNETDTDSDSVGSPGRADMI